MTCRKRRDDVETAGSRYCGTSFGGACFRTKAAVEDSCPTTSDSRSSTGSLSGSFRNPQSTAHRPLLLLDSLSLAYTLPRPPAWKYRTALPHSSAPPIAGWLIEFRLHNTTPSLHPVSGTSSLLRVVPPLVSASVLSPSWFFHLWLLRSHRSPRFPRSAQSPLTSSGHLNAGRGLNWDAYGHNPTSSDPNATLFRRVV
jgi:hypothetical protein